MSGIGPINYSSPVNFFIPQKIPESIPDAERGVFTQLFNTFQQIILTLVNNCGIGQQLPSDWEQLAGLSGTILRQNLGRFYVVAGEAISFGAAINLYDPGTGIIKVRNANATDNTKMCHGFCSTDAGIPVDTAGEVVLSSGLTKVNGLTVGQAYWLSTTNGLITNTRPVAAGNIEQYLGVALDTTTLYYNMSGYIQH